MSRIVLSHSGAEERDFVLHAGSFDALKKRLADGAHMSTDNSPYHFVSFVHNDALLDDLRTIQQSVDSPKVKKIFIVGIGGANLASEAIIDAFPKNLNREFIFLDTLYPGERDDIVHLCMSIRSKDECAIIIISKSGTTIETLANVELLLGILEERLGSVASQTIILTSKHSPLLSFAHHRKIKTITLSDAISDRFGVFSPIGILPLLFGNFLIEDFFKGAIRALDSATSPELGPVWQIAIAIDKRVREQQNVVLDFFLFSKRLETLGKWHRQLFAESLGKSETVSGRENPYAFTPTVSVGTTDLHSVLQLYLAEPTQRFAWFVPVKSDFHRSVDEHESFDSFLFGLAGYSPERTLGMIYESITAEYASHRLPFVETYMDSISEEALGFAMMNAMIVVVALAELWSLDPFTQPLVERYKEAVRQEMKTPENTEREARGVPITIRV